jgi:phosphotransferase system enzyme I (PtsI)
MAETLSGIGVSPGVATGPVAQMAPPPVVPTDATPAGDPEAENQAAMAAMRAVAANLEERASRAPGEAASVLAAQPRTRPWPPRSPTGCRPARRP